jgi:uncharacterized protein (DUF2237 family)
LLPAAIPRLRRSGSGARVGIVEEQPKNVLGGALQPCSKDPLTGFYRTGDCRSGPDDHGCHAVCTLVTEEFLAFSAAAGNDLGTPVPEYGISRSQTRRSLVCLCAAVEGSI